MSQRWSVTCQHCHDTAFVVLGDLPGLTDVVMASKCEHIDGRPLRGSDPMVCDSCGADIIHSGVEPSDQWTLLPDTFSTPATPNDSPWGLAADPTDIARVRLAIQTTQQPKARAAPRRRALRTEQQHEP